MNVEKMKAVVGSCLALVLIAGFAPDARSEAKAPEAANHSQAATAAGPTRQKAKQVSLPTEYKQLEAALALVKSNGLTIKDVVTHTGVKKNVVVGISEVGKLETWLEGNFIKYREFLTTCAVNSDRSSDETGRLLDGFISELSEAITEDPKKATGLKEKNLITYVTQMERVLNEKARIFASSKTDFEKADEKLLDQMKKTVRFLFGEYNEAEFNHTQQLADVWSQPATELATRATEALALRQGKNEKVCKLSEDKPAEAPAPTTPAPTTAVTKPKLDPTPIANGNGAGEGGPKQDGAPVDQNTGGGADVSSESAFIEPAGSVADNLQADALLQSLNDRFALLDEQARLDREENKRLADDARRLSDDILRQQQAVADAQNNDDNGLADALGRLATQQTPPPPPPAPPAAAPTIIPPSDEGQQAQQLPQPQQQPQEDFGQQNQAQGPQYLPAPPAPTPIIINGDDGASKYASAPPPVQTSTPSNGMLDLLRLQQQLAFAQQQGQGGQYAQNGGRPNVNTMANRISSGASGTTAAPRVIPGRLVKKDGNASGSAYRARAVR